MPPEQPQVASAGLERWRNALDQGWVLLVRLARAALGQRASLATEDRRLLEQVILPSFAAREDVRRVLFVGCDWYTQPYAAIFPRQEYWTIDREPARARFGSAKHITDSLARVDAHFPPGHLDLVVCNGVLGWGLDDLAEAERSFAATVACLAPGGFLLLGWNDIPRKRPFTPEDCRSLMALERWSFPPLGASRFLVAGRGRHTYDFFRKPGRDPGGRG